MTIIRDRQNQEYRVTRSDAGSFERFNIERCGTVAGYVNCHFTGDVLHIDDLCIYDRAMHQPSFSVDLCYATISFPPKQWRIANYQNRGLGTAMIDFLADYAREKLAKRLEGEIKLRDFKENPQLPEWYRRRGFAVVMGDGKSAVIAKISLAL